MNMPTDQNNKKSSFRYPFIAQEILKSGSGLITDYFFKVTDKENSSTQETQEGSESPTTVTNPTTSYSKENFDAYVKEFLRSEESRDSVLAGYFSAIMNSLIGKKKSELAAYFFSDPEIGSLFLERLESPSIVAVLTQFLNLKVEDSSDYSNLDDDNSTISPNLYTEQRVTIFSNLIEKFQETRDVDVRQSIMHVLQNLIKDITTVSGAETIVETLFFKGHQLWETLIQDIIAKEEKYTLEDKIFKKTSAELFHDLISLMDHNRKGSSGDSGMPMSIMANLTKRKFEKVADKFRKEYLFGQETWLVDFICKSLQQFADFLKAVELPKLNNTIGVEVRCLETHLLVPLDTIQTIIGFGIDRISTTFVESGLFDLMLELFIDCKWNSLYHICVGKLIKNILESDKDSVLFGAITHKGKLIKFLLECHILALKDKYKISGYIGIVNEISTLIHSELPQGKKELLTTEDTWADLQETHFLKIFEIESSERQDVFRKAFKKNSLDNLDGLLLMDSKSGFNSLNRFSSSNNQQDDNNEEEDNEIVDELNNFEADADDEGNVFSAGDDDEDDDTDEKSQKKEVYKSSIQTFRMSNELDADDVEIEGEDEKQESKKKTEENSDSLLESLNDDKENNPGAIETQESTEPTEETDKSEPSKESTEEQQQKLEEMIDQIKDL